jgi:hypothetical protein
MPFLCYDLRGIQSYIFQVPRLRHIIGGSAIIDRFDRHLVPDACKQHGWHLIASGGGKGTCRYASPEQADAIQDLLIRAAHGFGIDIRFGRHLDYSEAAHCADRLFPYLPDAEQLEGHPCPASGLYPTKRRDACDLVRQRDSMDHHYDARLSRWFEQRLLQPDGSDRSIPQLPAGLGQDIAFLHDVAEGQPGHTALGRRNRWSIICMDGNDMGRQFVSMADRNTDEQHMIRWVDRLGAALDRCSHEACVAGINSVLRSWCSTHPDFDSLRDEAGHVIVPMRPLVVGGDDIAMICHPAYAADFVIAASQAFEATSRMLATEAQKEGVELWPATGGRVTLSGGFVTCATTLPLASALPYAETLQALAKSRGRESQSNGAPSPACVDFETITETLLDHPSTRRSRQLTFIDGDLDEEVRLTRRPYTMDAFQQLSREAHRFRSRIPGSIRSQLLTQLRAGFDDRLVFASRLNKHQSELAAWLRENEHGQQPDGSRWQWQQRSGQRALRTTDLIDLQILAEEERRQEQETAQ